MPINYYSWDDPEDGYPQVSDKRIEALEKKVLEVLEERLGIEANDTYIHEEIQKDGFSDFHIGQIGDVMFELHSHFMWKIEQSVMLMWWTAQGIFGGVGNGIHLEEDGNDYRIFFYRDESTSSDTLRRIPKATFDAMSLTQKAEYLIQFARYLQDEERTGGKEWQAGDYDFNWEYLTQEVVDTVFSKVGRKCRDGSYVVESHVDLGKSFEKMLAARDKAKNKAKNND